MYMYIFIIERSQYRFEIKQPGLLIQVAKQLSDKKFMAG